VRRAVLLAGIDGLLCGLVVTLVGRDAVRFIAPVAVAAPLVSVLASVWLSASFALALFFLGWRSRAGSPGLEKAQLIARSAGCLLLTCTLALLLACAWGLDCTMTLAVFGLWVVLAASVVYVGLHDKRRRRALVAVGCCLLIASLPTTLWPLRITVALSRPALEELADRVEQGHVVRGPRWVGVLFVQASELRGATALLVTSPDPAGVGGLVRCAPSAAARFNLWSAYSIDPSWQLIFED
jgi:hypothetical protein